MIVEPSEGEVIAGPLYGEEGIVIADCDLRIGLHAKRLFDAAGHYGREDTLLPLLRLDVPDGGTRIELALGSRLRYRAGREQRSRDGALVVLAVAGALAASGVRR